MLTERKTAAALGLFDGVHLGHAKVLEKAARFAQFGFVPACFTFNNNSLLTKQERNIDYIYSDKQKEKYITELGIERIFSFDFEDIRTLSPEDFVKSILVDKMNCGVVVCGDDFKFGFNACAGAEYLKELCNDFSIECIVVEQLTFENNRISSADVRNALFNGNMDMAEKLLGRKFSVCGTVFCDKQKGSKMGFPTINLKTSAPLRLGVYATHVFIDGCLHKSITNVGRRPTFYEDSEIVAETHILDFNDNLYNKDVEVVFDGFLRDERKFGTPDELIAQINCDIERLRLF